MAKLGATTYTAVLWTTGDILTEAKLDNMVANDQAYDSHAAQGYGLNNDKAVASKDTGGTYRDICYLGTDDLQHLGPWDGWNKDWRTWTYASASTFTVPVNLTAVFRKGTKLRLKQGGSYKYFYVISSSYSAPNTTVTVTGGTDYTLANAAITDNDFSYVETPQGFPEWFNYTPTYTGFSVNPTLEIAIFKIQGKTCTLHLGADGGTSNATGFTISLPVAAATRTNAEWCGMGQVQNNGVTSNYPTNMRVPSGATSMSLGVDYAGNPFTASGTKGLRFGTFIYEI